MIRWIYVKKTCLLPHDSLTTDRLLPNKCNCLKTDDHLNLWLFEDCIWEIGAKHDFFDDFSEDYFEVPYARHYKLRLVYFLLHFQRLCIKYLLWVSEGIGGYRKWRSIVYVYGFEKGESEIDPIWTSAYYINTE